MFIRLRRSSSIMSMSAFLLVEPSLIYVPSISPLFFRWYGLRLPGNISIFRSSFPLMLYTVVLNAGVGSTMVYMMFDIFSSKSGISSSFIPATFWSLSVTPIMMDPPPPGLFEFEVSTFW
jgi:hypothetical protein